MLNQEAAEIVHDVVWSVWSETGFCSKAAEELVGWAKTQYSHRVVTHVDYLETPVIDPFPSAFRAEMHHDRVMAGDYWDPSQITSTVQVYCAIHGWQPMDHGGCDVCLQAHIMACEEYASNHDPMTGAAW